MAAPSIQPIKQVDSYIIFNDDAAPAEDLAKLVTFFISNNEHKQYLLPKFRECESSGAIKNFRVRVNANFFDVDDASCDLPIVRVARTKTVTNGDNGSDEGKSVVQAISFCPGERMRSFLAAIVQRVFDECCAPEAQATIDLQASLQFLADPSYEMMVSIDSPRVFDQYAPEDVEDRPNKRRIQQRPVLELKSVVFRPIPNHPRNLQYIAVNTRLQYPIKETTRKQTAERRNARGSIPSITFAASVPRIPAKRKANGDDIPAAQDPDAADKVAAAAATAEDMFETPRLTRGKLKRTKNMGK